MRDVFASCYDNELILGAMLYDKFLQKRSRDAPVLMHFNLFYTAFRKKIWSPTCYHSSSVRFLSDTCDKLVSWLVIIQKGFASHWSLFVICCERFLQTLHTKLWYYIYIAKRWKIEIFFESVYLFTTKFHHFIIDTLSGHLTY